MSNRMIDDPVGQFVIVIGALMVSLIIGISSCEGGRTQGRERAVQEACTTKKLVCTHEVTLP